jgi:hypothetical protein
MTLDALPYPKGLMISDSSIVLFASYRDKKVRLKKISLFVESFLINIFLFHL